MLHGMISIFQQVIVGIIVTSGSGAAAVFGTAAYRYLSRSLRKIAAKVTRKRSNVINVETILIVVVVPVGGNPRGSELPPVRTANDR